MNLETTNFLKLFDMLNESKKPEAFSGIIEKQDINTIFNNETLLSKCRKEIINKINNKNCEYLRILIDHCDEITFLIRCIYDDLFLLRMMRSNWIIENWEHCYIDEIGNINITDPIFENGNDVEIIKFTKSLIEDPKFKTSKLKLVMYDPFEGKYHRNPEPWYKKYSNSPFF
jgi:hypothetical protein